MKCVKARHKEDSEKTLEEELKDLKCGFGGVPIHSTLSFTPDELKYEDIQQTIKAINESEKSVLFHEVNVLFQNRFRFTDSPNLTVMHPHNSIT